MVVLSMDGRAAYPGALDTLNANMSGLAGSTTTLSLQDTSDDPPTEEQVTLTRGFIPPQTVFPEASPGPGLVALKITAFNKGTADQFTTALAALMAQRPAPTGLVLDLRGNRGGVLRQAVLVADSLLPTGMIVQTMGRDPDADQSFKAEGADLTLGAKLAVLVDGQTASAAEILAAALADNGRAVVIGSETLGKGLVQTLTSLPDGGELYVTWSRVLAPRGWPMQSLGVMPQVCTSLGPQMLETELASLDKGSNLQAQAVAAARTMRAPVAMDSVLQIRNQCPADIGTDMDFTAASRILASQAAYQAALLH
jgi:carboxyl-terminal processing protease